MVEYRLTEVATGDAERQGRRTFTDEEKRAIVVESETPGVIAAEICRRHGIATSMLFRWRVQLGYRRKPTVTLATVTGNEDECGNAVNALVMHDLLPVPDGMVAVDLPDGRRVFAPCDADPEQVRAQVAAMELQP
jgi:transposase-like protein